MNLELKNISFSFPKKIVLNNLSFFFEEGQIHAIIGENGSGKSTLANIICGELSPWNGELVLDNSLCKFSSPKDAISKGICYVRQKPLLAEELTVWENLIIGYKFSVNPKIKKKQKEKILQIANLFLSNIKLSTLTKNIPSDIRFFVSLTWSLIKNPKILVLDEPSSLLNQAQIELLYKKLQELKKQGMNILVITHNKEEVNNYADTTLQLKKEQEILGLNPKMTDTECIKISDDLGTVLYEWKDISCKTKNHIPLKNINFSVQSGQITLIKGRTEDGLSLLENIITAMNTFSAKGQFVITKNNQTCSINLSKKISPYDLHKKSGIIIGIVPTNKKHRASFPLLTIKQMITAKNKELEPDKIISLSEVNIQKEELCSNLSGGMLQRLLLNKELSKNPELLILCNPLQGLDSKAEEKLCNILQTQIKNNVAVLILAQHEFPTNICNNVFVIQKGELSPWVS